MLRQGPGRKPVRRSGGGHGAHPWSKIAGAINSLGLRGHRGDSVERLRALVTGRWLFLCGAASGILYVAVYVTQRAIQRGPGAAGGPALAWTLAAYMLATCGLFVLYAVVVVACGRNRIAAVRERRLAILIPAAFGLALLPTTPSLSIDVYSYMAHGYLQAGLGRNPYVVHSRAVAGTS